MFPLTALLRNLSRGWSLSLANYYFARNSSGFPVLLRFCDAQSLRSSSNSGWGEREKARRTSTIKLGMTWRFAERLREKLVWASSFRLKSPLLDRMDRKSKMQLFWKWLQLLDSTQSKVALPGEIRPS